MNIANKCVEMLPKWDDVSRNLPFLAVSGAVAFSFFMMSKGDRTNQKVKKSNAKQIEKKQQPTTPKSQQTPKPIQESAENQKDEIEEILKNKENAATEPTANTAHGGTGIEKGKSPRNNLFSANSSISIIKGSKGNFTFDSEKSKVSVYGPSRPTRKSQGVGAGGSKRILRQLNDYDGSDTDKELVRAMRRGSDDEELDEQADVVNFSQSRAPAVLPLVRERSKKSKNNPILKKINKNFATDTENNEKLQKLKQIASREKKAEDKIFFQMFMNIVGTEADDDDQ